jgi:ATP-dependent Lon protease
MNIWPKQQKEGSDEQPISGGAAVRVAERKSGKVKPIPEDALVIIPLRNAVLFPGTIAPLAVGRASSVAALQEAARTDSRIGFLLQRDREKNEVGPADLYWVGSVGETCAMSRFPRPRTTSSCRDRRAFACASSSTGGRSSWRASR